MTIVRRLLDHSCWSSRGTSVDADVFSVAAMAFRLEAKTLLQVPGQRRLVDRTGCLVPGVDRLGVQRSPVAVIGERGVEDDAMGVQLRVAGARRSVLEHGGHDLGGQDLERASVRPVPRQRGVLPDDEVERRADRIVVRFREFVVEFAVRHCPECAHGLVGAEGYIECRRPVWPVDALVELVALVELARVVFAVGVDGIDAGMEAVEGGIENAAAILKAEQVVRVPPAPVGLFTADIVVARRTMGGL